MMTTHDEAQRALAAKDAAERDLARLAICPPWRHAVFAVLMATLVAGPAVPVPFNFALLTLVFVGIALTVRSDRRRLGVFINGYRRGRTRWVVFPLLVVVLLLYGLSVHAALTLHQPRLSLLVALATLPIAYLGSVLWQRVFVRELGA